MSLADDLHHLLTAAVDRRVCSGATASIWHDGREVASAAVGWLSWEREQQVTRDTWFDLASLTKYFSAVTLLVLVERGVLDLDREIRDGFTLRHLLTHTSGLPAIFPGWEPPLLAWLAEHPEPAQLQQWPLANREALREQLWALPADHAPGERYEYSCVGFNTAMLVAEDATGRPWADLVTELTLTPLGLDVAFDAPTTPAATEVDPVHRRGTIQGQVHDEFSWALGGRCANAGLFGTATAVAAAFDALRRDELPCEASGLWQNQLPSLLGREVADPVEAPWGQSLGLRIGQQNFMASTTARGHTGFTGTSCCTDRQTGLTVALLTNRVHPTRDGDIGHDLRLAVARAARASLG